MAKITKLAKITSKSGKIPNSAILRRGHSPHEKSKNFKNGQNRFIEPKNSAETHLESFFMVWEFFRTNYVVERGGGLGAQWFMTRWYYQRPDFGGILTFSRAVVGRLSSPPSYVIRYPSRQEYGIWAR